MCTWGPVSASHRPCHVCFCSSTLCGATANKRCYHVAENDRPVLVIPASRETTGLYTARSVRKMAKLRAIAVAFSNLSWVFIKEPPPNKGDTARPLFGPYSCMLPRIEPNTQKKSPDFSRWSLACVTARFWKCRKFSCRPWREVRGYRSIYSITSHHRWRSKSMATHHHLNVCSTNAADLAALETLETVIRELMAEELLRLSLWTGFVADISWWLQNSWAQNPIRTQSSPWNSRNPFPFKKKNQPKIGLAESQPIAFCWVNLWSQNVPDLPSFGIIWTQKIDKGIANVAAVVHVHPVALGICYHGWIRCCQGSVVFQGFFPFVLRKPRSHLIFRSKSAKYGHDILAQSSSS